MSTLDTIVASAEDSLLPGSGHQLLAQQQAWSFLRASARADHVLSPTSQLGLKFMMSDAGNGFLDLASIRVSMRIRNLDGTNLDGTNPLLLTGAHSACLFTRLQSRLRGQLVDDILMYNRLVGMF